MIIGAGPAGIFTALELTKHKRLKVLIVDKGKDIDKRKHTQNSVISGWGGAGAFSDGKLTFSTDTGGWLREYVGENKLKELLSKVEKIYLAYGAPNEVYGVNEDAIQEIARKAANYDLKLVPSKIRHLGTESCVSILKKIRIDIENNADIEMETSVSKIIANYKVEGIEIEDGEKILAKYVVVAPGRAGSDWLKKEAERLRIQTDINPIDIGVRVEIPASVFEHLTKILYEPKFIYYSKAFDDKVRTFCVCPGGFVVPEYLDDVITVNGHSYKAKSSNNTNFAILVSTKFTEPFKDPIAYGKYIAKLANLLVDGVMVQRLGDLDVGRRSTYERLSRSVVEPTLKSAKPGDLSFVLPGRYLTDIKEMLMALDKLAPGVYSRHTLIYGVEVKFYSQKFKLNGNLESNIKNLFLIGDGAGITRGLVQSSASGLYVAEEILRREGLLN